MAIVFSCQNLPFLCIVDLLFSRDIQHIWYRGIVAHKYWLSTCSNIHLSILIIYLSIYLSIYLTIYLSIYLSKFPHVDCWLNRYFCFLHTPSSTHLPSPCHSFSNHTLALFIPFSLLNSKDVNDLYHWLKN